MTEPVAPTRLLDDPSLAGALRSDLELVQARAAIAYDTDAGLARFEQSMAAPASLPSVTGLRMLGWVIGASVIVSGVVGAASLIGVQADQPARISSVVTPRIDIEPEDNPVAGPSSSAPRVPVAEVTADDPGEQALGGTPAVDGTPTPPRPGAKSPEPPPTSTLADEAKQINAARKILESDPAKALALMEDAERQFPNGAMIQERRGYTILALVGLGRTAEAQTRASAYLERWPNGPLSRRIRDAL